MNVKLSYIMKTKGQNSKAGIGLRLDKILFRINLHLVPLWEFNLPKRAVPQDSPHTDLR
jgi:hypothetical protein